jgi:hypothetical protein
MNVNTTDHWVKLYDKLIYTDLWRDNNAWRVFTVCLLCAHYEDDFASVRFKGKQFYLKAGQFSATRSELAKLCRLTEANTKNAILRLKMDNRITGETSNRTTIFTVVNWKKYQGNGQPDTQQPDPPESGERTAQQGVKRNKEIKKKDIIVSKDTSIVAKLYYEYLKKYRIPVTNHNTLRLKIKELETVNGTEWSVRYLTFMLEEYEMLDFKYKPEINDALDLFRKSRSIEEKVKKLKESEEVY